MRNRTARAQPSSVPAPTHTRAPFVPGEVIDSADFGQGGSHVGHLVAKSLLFHLTQPSAPSCFASDRNSASCPEMKPGKPNFSLPSWKPPPWFGSYTSQANGVRSVMSKYGGELLPLPVARVTEPDPVSDLHVD